MLLSDRDIAEGRAMAQAELVDSCLITRQPPPSAGGKVFNEETGQWEDPTDAEADDPVTIYQGPCRFQIRSDINANIVEPQELEREWAYQTSTLQLPVDADTRIVTGTSGAVNSNDVCTVLTSRYDPSLPDRVFNIQASTHKTMSSVRRFRIREATR